MLNTILFVVCWEVWQEVAALLTNLIKELWLANLSLGVFQLVVQRQVYLQILLYAAFLAGTRGSTSQARKRLLPVLHKELFNHLARKEAAEMLVCGEMASARYTGETPKGMMLQEVVASQRPSPDNMVYLPGIAVPPGSKDAHHSTGRNQS